MKLEDEFLTQIEVATSRQFSAQQCVPFATLLVQHAPTSETAIGTLATLLQVSSDATSLQLLFRKDQGIQNNLATQLARLRTLGKALTVLKKGVPVDVIEKAIVDALPSLVPNSSVPELAQWISWLDEQLGGEDILVSTIRTLSTTANSRAKMMSLLKLCVAIVKRQPSLVPILVNWFQNGRISESTVPKVLEEVNLLNQCLGIEGKRAVKVEAIQALNRSTLAHLLASIHSESLIFLDVCELFMESVKPKLAAVQGLTALVTTVKLLATNDTWHVSSR